MRENLYNDPSNDNTVMEKIVANILETRFENFNESLLDNARDRVIDTIGCLIGGASAPGNRELIEMIKYWGGREEATIFFHGGKVPAQNAAMANCIMARSLDSDPNTIVLEGRLIPSHISGTSIMTAITMGEATGSNCREIMTAMLAGEDLASRIAAAASSRKRVDNIGTINVFCAAAIAGRLLGLDHFQMRNALGISLDHVSGTYQNVYERTTSFKLSQGVSARSGIFSAQLAQRGWTASKDPLTGGFGYFNLYFDDFSNIDILTRDLGNIYYTEGHFKPFPSCRYNHGPIECIFSIEKKYGSKIDEIKEVAVYVSKRGLEATVGKPFCIGDFPCADGLFSYQYAVANALLRKSIRPQHFTNEFISAPEIGRLAKKIRLAELPDAELLETKVDIILNDGRKFSEFVKYPKGDQENNPISKDELKEKFMSNFNSSPTMRDKTGELLGRLNKFEELESLDEIIKLMVV